MNKIYYKKSSPRTLRRILQVIGFGIFSLGFMIMIYIFLPVLSWQVYFAPVFASQRVTAPIPKTVVVSAATAKSFLGNTLNQQSIDYTNAQNWFPNAPSSHDKKSVSLYTLTIPAIGMKDATVSTIDNDLGKHLVHYGSTALPPHKGNAVIFGHSTLPQLFNKNDYKTIFANLYTLKIADQVGIRIGDVSYYYSIFSITVVEPEETSIFEQPTDDSYLTLVTCTPPGTTWKRLIIKARLSTM